MKFKPFLITVIMTMSLTANSFTTCLYAAEPVANGTSTESTATSDATSDNTEAVENNSKWPLGPTVNAGSAILIDADTGTILYEKNAHEKAYPASTTKLMTSLLALENCSLSETVTFSYEASHSVIPGDANIATKEGEKYSLEQSLYAILLPSANEVAYGVAEHVAGSAPSFVNMMNQRAHQLGATDTHFNNPSGLFDENHYTTAYDMAMIGRACMENSTMISIMQTLSYQIPPTNKTSETRYLSQKHGLLKKGIYHYDNCVGGKTGFTDESQYTLVSFASKGDMNLICVVFQCELEEYRYSDSVALFEWGFNNFSKISITSEDAGLMLNNMDYFKSRVFNSPNATFTLEASYLTLPANVDKARVTHTISRDSEDEAFATVKFMYDNRLVGYADIIVSNQTDTAHELPSNLPVKKISRNFVPSNTEYLTINAWHIAYCLIFFVLLLIILFVLVFIKYSPQGREIMKTRKRRKGYGKNRNIHF